MAEYIGHTKIDKNGKIIAIQSLRDHLLNSKKYAEKFGSELNIAHVTGLAAILHDLGKYRSEFQDYIKTGNEKRGSIDHSTFGGAFIKEYVTDYIQLNECDPNTRFNLQMLQNILMNAIFSHHNTNGLKDYLLTSNKSPFLERIQNFLDSKKNVNELKIIKNIFYSDVMSKANLDDYFNQAFTEFKRIVENILTNKDTTLPNLAMLGNYVYSCLLDADRTDAANFEYGKEVLNQNNSQKIFKTYYRRLVDKLDDMNKGKISQINQYRAEMSQECDDFATKKSGIYTLSLPTGGGKTLASMRLSLKHSILHNKKRIIYVLPYITIIEQNARVFREKLNNNENDTTNILEFHSNISQKLNTQYSNISHKQNNFEFQNLMDLAEDNWDSPIVITTMVQFLNTFYSSGTKNRRRLHNLCNSVIVFDEIQKLPIETTALFNYAINFLQEICNCNIILCTATQPALDKINDPKLNISKNAEIISDLDERIDQFKRVKFINKMFSNGRKSDLTCDEAAVKIFEATAKTDSILAVFNTISATEKVFTKLNELLIENNVQIPVYYLSTRMCPAHRKDVIKDIKNRLEENQPVICISTPLIEAGVDISFKSVFRSACGLDSIIQTAGRCNRNSETDCGYVYLISIKKEEENLERLKTIKAGQEIMLDMITSQQADITNLLDKNVVAQYFNIFYKKENLNGLTQGKRVGEYNLSDYVFRVGVKENNINTVPFSDFETIAKNFEVITQNTTSIIVPYGNKAKDIIAEINGVVKNKSDLKDLMKKAQSYIVNVYKNVFDTLDKERALEVISPENSNTAIYALKEGYYNEYTGLTTQFNADCVANIIF
ncbi:CRISPR-associated endonuclease/helicase Cas3 [Lactobacillus colini]|uniref:CRISPR-associated endonuclease/helicase Cas3 n=1 Tax=Lactobacillus colini TaxID=1819254 RepID=A0ABS4MH20_9LACO|nr:CRISPR-associated helicase Cas3' [Lactobacillus colini]MBP2058971.1 CRISPR-associated endonuclease/helicase Cas3 [Lactobacillus colini]